MADPFEQYINKAKATLAGGEDDDQQAPQDPFSAYVAKKQEAVQPQGDQLDEALKRPDIGGPVVQPPPLPTEAPAQPAGAFLRSNPNGDEQMSRIGPPEPDTGVGRVLMGAPYHRTYLGQLVEHVGHDLPGLHVPVQYTGSDDADQGFADLTQHPAATDPLTKTLLGGTATEELEKLLKNVPQDKQGNLTPFQNKAMNDAVNSFAGGVQGVTGAVEGLSSPQNLAIMASMMNPLKMPQNVKRLASLIFAKQMGEGAYNDFQEARKAELTGNNRQAAQLYTSGMINGLFTILSGTHAVHGEGVSEHEANVARAQEYYENQGHNPADALDMAKHAYETYKATGDIDRMPPVELDEQGQQKATSRLQPITATRETQQPPDATQAPEVAQDAFTRYLEASKERAALPEQQPEVKTVPEGQLGLDRVGFEQAPETQPSALGAKATPDAADISKRLEAHNIIAQYDAEQRQRGTEDRLRTAESDSGLSAPESGRYITTEIARNVLALEDKEQRARRGILPTDTDLGPDTQMQHDLAPSNELMLRAARLAMYFNRKIPWSRSHIEELEKVAGLGDNVSREIGQAKGVTETRDQMHAMAPVEYIKQAPHQPGAVWVNDTAHQAFSQALVDAGEETNNANSWQAITVHKTNAIKLIAHLSANLSRDFHEETSNIPRVRQDYADKLALLRGLMQNYDNDGHLILVKSSGMADLDAVNLSHEQVHHVQNQWHDKLGNLLGNAEEYTHRGNPQIFKKVADGLQTYGYKVVKDNGSWDGHTVWAEGAAHIITGESAKLGLTDAEAAEFLDHFFSGVVRSYGGSRIPLYDMLHSLSQIGRLGKEAIERANERHKPVFEPDTAGRERAAAAAGPREIPERLAPRTPGGFSRGAEDAGVERPSAGSAPEGPGDLGPGERPPVEPPAGGDGAGNPPGGEGPFGSKAAVAGTGVREVDEDIERQLHPPGPVRDLSPRTLWNKSAEKLWDRFAFWRAAVKDMTARGVQLSPDTDPGTIFDLTYGGTHGIVEAEMLDLKDTVKAADKDGVLWQLRGILNLKGYSRVFDINQERMGKAHAEMQRANYNASHASSPAAKARWKELGRQAAQDYREAQAKATGIKGLVPRYKDQAQVTSMLAQLEAKDPAKYAKAMTYAEKVWDMSRRAWDEAHNSGIISDEVHKQGVQRGKEYIPMQRIMDQIVDDTYQRALSSGLDLKRQDILKNLQGSELLNREPIGASFDQFTQTIKEVARNEAAKVAIAALQKDPVYSKVVTKLEPGEAPPLGFGAIGHYENGERVTHVLPRLLADALNTANARDVEPFSGVIGKVMKAARKVSQLGYTGWNLAFSIPNVIKDQKDLLLLSKIVKGDNPVTYAKNLLAFEGKWLGAAYHILRKDQAYRDFLKSKVAYAGLQKQISPDAFLRLGREGFYEGMPGKERFRVAAGKVGYFGGGFLVHGIEQLNNAFEEASKMSAYNTLREQGLDPTAAAIEARRFGGSPDFAVGGTMKQELDTLFLFFNARTQGIIRTASRFGGLKDHPIMLAGLTSLALMAYAHNMQYKSDDGTPEYDHLSPQIKQNYWTLFLPVRYQTAKGDHRWLAIHMPKSHVEQVLVNPITEMLQKAYGDPKTPTQIMLDAAGNATPINFNVQQGKLKETGVRSLVSSLNPAIREPVEQMTNEDTLTGAPIVPKRLLPYEPQYQDTPSTNPTSRFLAQTRIGKALELSAPRIQHATRTLGGGAGEMLLGIGDAVANKADSRARNYAALEEGPEQFSRAPIAGAVLRRFVASGGDEEERSDLDKLYHHYDKAEQVVREVNAFEKQGTPESHAKAVEILKADPMNQFYYDNFGPIQSTIKNIGELRNALISVQNAGVIGDEKSSKNANPAARLALRKKAISALYREYRQEVKLGADLRFNQEEEPEQQPQEQVQ